jgi:DNA-binding SARP family transcriptional activator
MEFRLLGPVEALDGDRTVRLGGPKQRALLAALLLRANQVVSSEQLIDDLWGARPPATARNLLQGYVADLRKALAEPIVHTRSPGYLLAVEHGSLDLDRFEALVGEAREDMTQGRPVQAATRLRAALALRRGRALVDVPAGPLVDATVPHLEERYIAALEARIDADLASGRAAELVGELEALVAAYPLRERLRGHLMLALYHSQRQAEALEVYRETRRLLVEEVGLEPGGPLQQLERAILASGPAPPGVEPVLGAALPHEPPRQLPPDITDFTSRSAPMARLRDLLLPAGSQATAVPVAAVVGQAGVGKTAFAVHVAHQLSPQFPDGQLYVDLRGAEAEALDPGAVLGGFLRALGLPGSAIPESPQERVQLYRTRIADRRVLVLLDNAADESQVRPLLPGTAGSAVLVTSRRRLTGLSIPDVLDLDLFDPSQALDLLGRIVGPTRLAAEREAARLIVERCGRLPLALRIAGARVAAKPHWRLQRLADLLAAEHRRLDELAAGDLDVRGSISLSYQALDPDRRRALRLLGLLTTASFPIWLAAALLGTTAAQADRLVEGLVDDQLLEPAGEDALGVQRYRFHDLLRAFARERLAREETEDFRRAALQRALAACLAAAQHADALLRRSDDQARWFEVERATLVLAVEQAHAEGLGSLAWRIAAACSAFFEARSHWDDWSRTHLLGLDAAEKAADLPGRATMLRRLGDLHLDRTRWTEAREALRRCLPLYRELGDRGGEAKALRSLADVAREQSQWDEALAHYSACLPIFTRLGDLREEAEVRRGLGIIARAQGRLEEALDQFSECMSLSERVGDRRWEAIARRSQSLVFRDLGRAEQAAGGLLRCLEDFSELGDRLWEAYTLNALGSVRGAQGRLDDARYCYARSAAVFSELGDRSGEAYARLGLGETAGQQGQADEAARHLERCLVTFSQIGARFGLARTLCRLGQVYGDLGRTADAVAALRRCLALCEALGLRPLAEDARRDLDALR